MFADPPPKIKYKTPKELAVKNRLVTKSGGHFENIEMKLSESIAERVMNEKEKDAYYDKYTLQRRYTSKFD
jgi:hypothetical protein